MFEELRSSANQTAVFLGYLAMALLIMATVVAICWMAQKIASFRRQNRYERWQERNRDAEFAAIRQSWLAEDRKDHERNTYERHDTDVLPIPHDDVYDYIQEINNERA